ncbi:MAG: dTDP-4-amino-4,6-dideoxygalactose transaminase [Schwartzia succinivorans]|uniref:dTDP-4-amino-4,6-dideoxygalactose transaminase n=1 Tax=Schwartzia succinivorans TaxID=55507 RepID=UPI0023532B0F|nr:dTDP-4-amino-4,6-dideoxygalactose transaminase [Schwartzia succinivorans]MBE6096656.1 dTDP-4-amino-4,6-dideoxygalactose transaminase [Schwartzia succinivorans]
MIHFNQPVINDDILSKVKNSILSGTSRGDGSYCKLCSSWIEEHFNAKKALLTGSCSHALELAALLCDIGLGDEVIMPSYTFCSTANAFALRGAKIVFVDVRPDTMNIDEKLIEGAVTPKTKAIVPVHYAGISCEMDTIMDIAQKHNLFVVEDAAQGVMSRYKGRHLGTIGDIGCYSFHETKNYSMGEGGAILVNNEAMIERAEIIREKGTNRALFLRGQIDKYSWVDIGSSYLPADMSAAMLYAQLKIADKINEKRRACFDKYFEMLKPLADEGKVELPVVPEECRGNGHIFYVKVKDIDERTELISYLKQHEINALFHYVPLHSSIAGRKYGRFDGEDIYTTNESNRLVRLPLYYDLEENDIAYVVSVIEEYYSGRH